jgi:RNA polymerase sigma-70 factor, ECF subfamily
MAGDLEVGLAVTDGIVEQGDLDAYQWLHAARGDLLRRLGRRPEAAEAYRRALDLASNPGDRTFLQRRLKEVTEAPPP